MHLSRHAFLKTSRSTRQCSGTILVCRRSSRRRPGSVAKKQSKNQNARRNFIFRDGNFIVNPRRHGLARNPYRFLIVATQRIQPRLTRPRPTVLALRDSRAQRSRMRRPRGALSNDAARLEDLGAPQRARDSPMTDRAPTPSASLQMRGRPGCHGARDDRATARNGLHSSSARTFAVAGSAGWLARCPAGEAAYTAA